MLAGVTFCGLLAFVSGIVGLVGVPAGIRQGPVMFVGAVGSMVGGVVGQALSTSLRRWQREVGAVSVAGAILLIAVFCYMELRYGVPTFFIYAYSFMIFASTSFIALRAGVRLVRKGVVHMSNGSS